MNGFWRASASIPWLLAGLFPLFASAGAPPDCREGASCTFFKQSGCPVLEVTGSPGLKAHPLLLDAVVAELRRTAGDFDCTPLTSEEGETRQNGATHRLTLVTERPGLVCVRTFEEVMHRGAGHPNSSEALKCFEAGTAAPIEFSAVLPTLLPDSSAWQEIARSVDGTLTLLCCEGFPSSQTRFEDIGLSDPFPSGWAITDAGDLELGFRYWALGRSFMATAVVPRATVIDAVAPQYRPAFTVAPSTSR